MNLVRENGAITVAPRDFPTNNGGLCRKGWTSTRLLRHAERLTTPLMRDSKDGELRPVAWHTALGRIAAEFEKAQACYGRDAVGVFGGGGLTNEKAYMLGKFARVALRTANIDYNGRFCMSSAAAANVRAFGIDRGMPFPLEDIAKAKTILLVGSNLAETMPPVMQYFDEQKRNGGNLIVVDPRATPTAQEATLHLQIAPGTDMALALGLLHIATRDRLLDHTFIAARTTGYRDVRRVVAGYWPERVEAITGVPIDKMTRAAHLLGKAATALILTARGPEQQSKGVDTVLAFINLALALGKAGKPACGYGCLTGQGNGQGGREHGQKADQLPGYRSIENEADRAHIASVWGIAPDELPGKGRSAYELLDTMGQHGGLRALLVMGSNVAVSSPNAGHVQERLNALDFLVVADLFLSETAARADVVLPATQWAEEEGTMTNLEGRVLVRRRAQQPPHGVRSDLQIIHGIAERMGHDSKFPTEAEVVFNELRRATAGAVADYAGITYERIERDNGVFWPCPDEAHPGTPRLFLDRFATSDGLARFHAVEHRNAGEEPDAEYPLYFTTGRVMGHYQSGTQTRRVGELLDAAPRAFVEIHPALATNFGIEEGDVVCVSTRRGEAQFEARLVSGIRQDTLFAPFHWGGDGCANLLTNPALDPISRMPEYKVCAARLEPAVRLASVTDVLVMAGEEK
jgi:assimilatory nitrate reductase catalytic subunit